MSYSLMKRPHQSRALLLVLLSGWFAQANLPAQPHPVIPRRKGIGVGSNVNGYGTDVQVLGNLAFLSWRWEQGGDTDHPGGMKIFSLTTPIAPVRVGGY